jgi:t-SNARE complex subunit (syntaxin)
LDAETQSQIDDLIELREAHKRRKRHLEVQLALLGISAGATMEIDLESANESILAIEATLTRLRQVEVRHLASILPNSIDPDVANVDLHNRLNAISHYVLGVENAIHKEIGAVLRLFDTHNMVDEKQRKSRQKRVDVINIAIVILLFLIFVVLLLK